MRGFAIQNFVSSFSDALGKQATADPWLRAVWKLVSDPFTPRFSSGPAAGNPC